MKILCFGDSNTYGFDPRSFFGERYPAQHRWVDIVAEKSGWEAINEGENGREIPATERELHRFHTLIDSHKTIDRLIIMLGTNDLLQGNEVKAVRDRMERFLRHIDLDRSKILLICPKPMALGAWVPSRQLVDASTELSGEYKALARSLGIPFADAGQWDIPLAFDGVHFTEEGHHRFAKGLLNLLYSQENGNS